METFRDKPSLQMLRYRMSVLSFTKCRALQGLKDSTYQRVSKVGDLAKEQAAGAGQSDLRRLKRQFSSLKNTFMLYHTKEHFIDGRGLAVSS